MATPRYGLNTNYTDGVTEYTGPEIARLHRITDTQLGGAVEAFGVGVLKDPNEDSLKVTASTGRNVTIAPGRGFARHSTYGGFFFEITSELTIGPLPANSTVYILSSLQMETVSGEYMDTRETGSPKILASGTDTVDGALVQAEVVVGAATITSVTDRRIFISLGGGASVPTGTGFPHIISGVQQAAAKLVQNADVATDAAITESKLALASDAAAGTASRRTLGTGAQQAAAGNHGHSNATTSAAGFMSGTDKTRLDASTASPTAGTLMVRDSNGRAQIAAPSSDSDIATKKYVDDATTAGAPDADATTKGITKLSVAPASDPIAVGDNDPRLQPFEASGDDHASGLVPDPGSTSGSSKFLREDATWATPPGGSLSVTQDGEPPVNDVNSIIVEGGTVMDNEDGSVTLEFTPTTIGAAPTVHTHAASDITSGTFDIARLATGTPDGTKFVRDDGTLAVPPGGGGGGGLGIAGVVKAHLTGTQSIPNNSITAVAFSATDTDDADYWDAGTPTKFVVPTGYAGTHDIKALVEFPTNSTGNRAIAIYVNGSSIAGLVRFAAAPGNDTNVSISWTAELEDGDEVEIYVSQNSGGALNIQPQTAVAITRLAVVDEINALKIQGRDVAATAPSDGQVLAWNAGASEYQPADQSGGGGGSVDMYDVWMYS